MDLRAGNRPRSALTTAGPVVIALLLAGTAAGCRGDAPPDYARSARALGACPQGDGPWRRALDAAARERRTEELLAAGRELERRCEGRWEPAWMAGEAAKRLGRRDEAREAFRRALDSARKLQDPAGVSCCEAKLGWLAFLEGRPAEAETAMRRAIDAARRAGRVDLESFARNNLAGVLTDAGRWAEAEREMRAARDGLARAGLEDAARGAAYNGAVLLLMLGDAEGARRVLTEAHAEAVAANDGWTADATSIALGNVHRALEQLETAESWFARVGRDRPEMRARALLGRGRIALARRDPARAAGLLDEAADLARDEDHLLFLLVEIYRAVARERSGKESSGDRLLELAREAERVGAGEPSWVARWLLGRRALDAGQPDEAERHLVRATSLLIARRGEFGLRKGGLRFLRERFEPFVDLALARLAGEGPRPGDAGAGRLLEIVDQAAGRAAGDSATSSSRARALRTSLPPGEAVLTFLVGNRRSLALAATNDGWLAWSPPGRTELADPLARYRGALVRWRPMPADARAAGRLLARELLGPLAAELRGTTRLWIVPDRELALLPFGELPAPAPLAIRKDAAPLSDLLEVARLTRPAPPPRDLPRRGGVLLAGLPRLDPGQELPELAWAAWELDHLGRIWRSPDTTLLTGEDFTIARLRTALARNAAIVHIASHAVASTSDPDASGILLSFGERLRPSAVESLRLPRSIVVLSACRTGEGELVPGAGVIGLGSSFAAAGAGAVVMSLWTADDAATARLMVAFHDHLRRGRDPAAALSAARREAEGASGSRVPVSPFVVILAPER